MVLGGGGVAVLLGEAGQEVVALAEVLGVVDRVDEPDRLGELPLGDALVASGVAEQGIYLIRFFPARSDSSVPRRVFLHHGHHHTVTVTVFRPTMDEPTYVDVAVAVR